MKKIGYDKVLDNYKNTLDRMVGPTKIMISGDMLQVNDYERYNWTMFDPDAKKERHAKVFPEDKKKAFSLGAEMVSGTWQSL